MAQKIDLIIDQGADAAVEFHLVNTDGSKKDLTDYSVTSKIKHRYNTTDSDDIFDFTAIVTVPESDGIINLSLTNAQTDLMVRSRYVYDVELSYLDSDSNTIIERVIEGDIEVNPSVTK